LSYTSLAFSRTSINRGGIPTPDFEDNFTCDNFTDSGSKVAVACGVMGSNNDLNICRSYRDFGACFVGVCWTLRFSIHPTTICTNSSGNNNCIDVGLFDTCAGLTTSQDGIAFTQITFSSSTQYRFQTSTGQVPHSTATDGTFSDTPSVCNTRYIDLRRSCCAVTASIYNDACFTCLNEALCGTYTGSADLRWLKIGNAWATGNGRIDDDIDDLKFWKQLI